MNPLVKEFLESVLKKLLTGAGAVLVTHGWITEEQSARFLVGAIALVISVIWSVWTSYKDRLKLLVAQALPEGATEQQVEAKVKEGVAPPAALPKTGGPHLSPPKH